MNRKLTKRSKILLIAITAFAIVGYFFYDKQRAMGEIYPDYEKIEYRLEGKRLKLLVADTTDKRQKGLMHHRQLEGIDGMIFIHEQKKQLHYWNKNTFMDLDVYWIEDDKVVGKSFLPSVEKSKSEVVVSSPQQVNRVIEIPK